MRPLAPMRFAGVPRRAIAYALDCALVLAGVVVTQLALVPINLARAHPSATAVQLWVFATVTFPTLLYFAWREASPIGATPAAAWLGLRVATLDGGRVSVGRALIRNAIKLVPFELNHVAMFHARFAAPSDRMPIVLGVALWLAVAMYLALAALTARHQSAHDLIARTIVVDTREIRVARPAPASAP